MKTAKTSVNNYYPFGMLQPGYSYSSETHRFGFNGMEKDDEIKGTGNSLDFGARVYDSRLGRFMSLDPISNQFPDISNYSLANNNPILNYDYFGLEATHYKLNKNEDGTTEKIEGQTDDEINGVKVEGDYRIYHFNGATYTFGTSPEGKDNEIFRFDIKNEKSFAADPEGQIVKYQIKSDQQQYTEYNLWKKIGKILGLDDPIQTAIDIYFLGKGVKAFNKKITESTNINSEIMPYKEAQKLTKGHNSQIQAHKLFEKRHAKRIGIDYKNIPSVILTKDKHLEITNQLRNKMPYGNRYDIDNILKSYQEVYKPYPSWYPAAKSVVK